MHGYPVLRHQRVELLPLVGHTRRQTGDVPVQMRVALPAPQRVQVRPLGSHAVLHREGDLPDDGHGPPVEERDVVRVLEDRVMPVSGVPRHEGAHEARPPTGPVLIGVQLGSPPFPFRGVRTGHGRPPRITPRSDRPAPYGRKQSIASSIRRSAWATPSGLSGVCHRQLRSMITVDAVHAGGLDERRRRHRVVPEVEGVPPSGRTICGRCGSSGACSTVRWPSARRPGRGGPPSARHDRPRGGR